MTGAEPGPALMVGYPNTCLDGSRLNESVYEL